MSTENVSPGLEKLRAQYGYNKETGHFGRDAGYDAAMAAYDARVKEEAESRKPKPMTSSDLFAQKESERKNSVASIAYRQSNRDIRKNDDAFMDKFNELQAKEWEKNPPMPNYEGFRSNHDFADRVKPYAIQQLQALLNESAGKQPDGIQVVSAGSDPIGIAVAKKEKGLPNPEKKPLDIKDLRAQFDKAQTELKAKWDLQQELQTRIREALGTPIKIGKDQDLIEQAKLKLLEVKKDVIEEKKKLSEIRLKIIKAQDDIQNYEKNTNGSDWAKYLQQHGTTPWAVRKALEIANNPEALRGVLKVCLEKGNESYEQGQHAKVLGGSRENNYFGEAEKYYQITVDWYEKYKTNPVYSQANHAQALTCLASAQFKRDKLNAAEDSCTKALSLAGNYAEAQGLQEKIYREKSTQAFDEINPVGRRPGSGTSSILQEHVARDLKQGEEAYNPKGDSSDGESNYGLAEIYFKNAIAQLEDSKLPASIKSKPEIKKLTVSAYMNLAKLYLDRGIKLELADKLCAQALAVCDDAATAKTINDMKDEIQESR